MEIKTKTTQHTVRTSTNRKRFVRDTTNNTSPMHEKQIKLN